MKEYIATAKVTFFADNMDAAREIASRFTQDAGGDSSTWTVEEVAETASNLTEASTETNTAAAA